MNGERVYTINLSKVYHYFRNRRANKAIKLIREFAKRHTKAKEVKISRKLNEKIWERSIQRPPRRVKVRMKVEGNTCYVMLFDEKEWNAEEKKAKGESKKEKKEVKEKKKEEKNEKEKNPKEGKKEEAK